MFFLDLFSGAGGLAEGFVSEGFIPVAHVEMDFDAISTLRTRAVYHYLKAQGKISVYADYLKNKFDREHLYGMLPEILNNTMIHQTMSNETTARIYELINKNMKEMNCTEIDVLVGGPPCQTYSIISRNMKNYDKEDDQRNHLYKIYTQVLAKYKPKFFVFENVPGLKTINQGKLHDKLIALITDAGYKVSSQILDASDFGVLQKRTRLIITGWRKDLSIDNIVYNPKPKAGAVVNDLLYDLSSLVPGEMKNEYVHPPKKYLIDNGMVDDDLPLTLHMCRFQNKTDREIYRIAAKLWNEEGKRLVYPELNPELITRTNPNTFTDKYKVVPGNLPYSHTVIAHIARDGHYYIHPDVDQARSISVREAARLQSFPDSYFFEGARRKVFIQIGNAVPPLMAMQIAAGIKEVLIHGERNNQLPA